MSTVHEESQFAELDQFEDMHVRTISKVGSRFVQARGESSPNHSITPSSTPAPLDSHSMTRLPPLQSATIDGDCSQWVRFQDTFCSLGQDSERLSDIDRFNYLVSALSGATTGTVESFSVNYKLAWARLKE